MVSVKVGEYGVNSQEMLECATYVTVRWGAGVGVADLMLLRRKCQENMSNVFPCCSITLAGTPAIFFVITMLGRINVNFGQTGTQRGCPIQEGGNCIQPPCRELGRIRWPILLLSVLNSDQL